MEQITIEDYLKTMYDVYENLKEKDKGIKSVEIATSLKIKKPSAFAILKKLAKLGYIDKKPYSSIHLSEIGLKEAKRITHNHRVIEFFLKEILKCDLKNIHEEAHKLEHAFSDETLKKLYDYLGNPKISPYGKRIP